MTHEIKVGDWVRVVGVPPDVVDKDGVNTRTIFEKCVRRFFRVEAIEQVEGLAHPLMELHVGRVLGYENFLDSIWIEPKYVKAAKATIDPQLRNPKDTTCPS